MKRVIYSLALALALLTARQAAAAPVKVAVANFDFADTSGEVENQTAFHDAQIKGLEDALAAAINRTGRFTATSITCARQPCSVGNLDPGSLTDAGKKAGAAFMIFGGVHKISTLITFGRVDMVDLATGRSVMDRDITFRGDDKDAWQHADSYIGDMVTQALNGLPAQK
jgi:hypothetical protein